MNSSSNQTAPTSPNDLKRDLQGLARTRSVEEKVEIIRLCLDDLGAALAAGRLSPHIDTAFPMAEAGAAYAHLAANAHVGKIVVEID